MANRLAFVGGRVVDPERPTPRDEIVLVADGRIVDRRPPAERGALADDWQLVDLDGRWLAPGFIDLHFHGELFGAAPEDFGGALDRAAEGMLPAGTTAFLATTVAWGRDELGPRVSALAEVVAARSGDAAACLGLHLEGPWISPGAPGAMTPGCLRPFEPSRDVDVLERAAGLLRMVTLAPELEGADALLDELAARGVLASLGHSGASADAIENGVARGLRHVTHLFNAMGPVHHRAPGVAGHALAEDRLSCDLICDGHHVHPSIFRIAARALGERLVLITDRVDLETPRWSSGDGAPARLADGTIAGSQLDLAAAVRNARRFADLDPVEAIAACTVRPARLLGIEGERGTLRSGARADLVVIDAEGRVVETWLAGRRVSARPASGG